MNAKTTAPIPTIGLNLLREVVSEQPVRRALSDGNPHLRQALAAIPGLAAVAAASQSWESLNAAPTPAGTPAVHDVANRLAGALLDGQAVTADDVNEAASSAALAEIATANRRVILDVIRQNISSQLAGAVTGGLDQARTHLHHQLTAIVSEVRTRDLANLTAESAIQQGRPEDYQALTQMATTYEGLRAAQRRLDIVQLGDEGVMSGHYKIASVMCGAAQHWSGYGHWARAEWPIRRPDSIVNRPTDMLPPWPDLASAESVDVLSFLASANDLTPWVPTGSQLQAEMTRLAAEQRNAALEDVNRNEVTRLSTRQRATHASAAIQHVSAGNW